MITGASSGIGAALARGFARHGARTALIARRKQRLEQIVEELGNDNAIAVPADVAIYSEVKDAAATIFHWAKQVQVLVNCAGVYPPERPNWQLDPFEWERTLAINLNGVFNCTRAFLPAMLTADYGRIINISSEMVAVPNAAAYSVSKNAVDVLTAITARELEMTGKDVCINSVDPGGVQSEMNPAGTLPATAVLPIIMKLATLPKGGSNGRKWRYDEGSCD